MYVYTLMSIFIDLIESKPKKKGTAIATLKTTERHFSLSIRTKKQTEGNSAGIGVHERHSELAAGAQGTEAACGEGQSRRGTAAAVNDEAASRGDDSRHTCSPP